MSCLRFVVSAARVNGTFNYCQCAI
jgi:hypothetical protein